MATIGLKNLYFAPFLDEAAGTYAPPVKIADAIEANVEVSTESATLYGDDRAIETADSLGDIEVELNVADLLPDKYALLLGKTKNADGVIEDSIDDVAPYGALSFELPKANGDKKLYVYYKGKFQPPGTEATTKGDSVEFQTQTINGKFLPREDGKWRAHLDTSDADADAAVASAWFAGVYDPTPTV